MSPKLISTMVGVAYAAPLTQQELTVEHPGDVIKLLIWVVGLLGGLLYSIGAFAFVSGIKRLKDQDKIIKDIDRRLLVIETEHEPYHLHKRKTDIGDCHEGD